MSSTTSNTRLPSRRGWSWWFVRLLPSFCVMVTMILMLILLGVAQRAGWLTTDQADQTSVNGAAADADYTCSMHPQIRQTGPGSCPICGMKLVVASSNAADLDELAVQIEPAQRRLANIQTAVVESRPVRTEIRTVGGIKIDESRQATIAAYTDGRVERMFADYTGVDVARGDHLAVVYSPQLYSAQVEYLESRAAFAEMNEGALAAVRRVQEKLVANSRQKLVELGMTEEQITEIETSGIAQSRLTIFAPIGGTVIEKLAEEGKYIKSGEPIYRIANLSTIWLMLELYPEDASRIRFGQRVIGELPSLPGETLTGRVAFIDPTVDTKTRTVGVRVEFDNRAGRLRPGDYAQATIEIPIGPQGDVYDKDLAGKWISPMHPQVIMDEPGDCPICGMKLIPTSRFGFSETPVDHPPSLTVPRSAVLLAGEHSVVYVETDEGRFEIRPITLGPMLRDRAIILSGLKAGEKVATSGNFLIDSQMQLAGKPSLIDPDRAIAQQFRNTPLVFDSIQITRLSGSAGVTLEELYAAYFQIQTSLAADEVPQESDVTRLVDRATALQDSPLAESERELLLTVVERGGHLHHMSLADARIAFKPISHVMITLATRVRGEHSSESFQHFFCPMVKQGEGDWLQSQGPLRNPYYGSEMLKCGELVRELPQATPAANGDSKSESNQEAPESSPGTDAPAEATSAPCSGEASS